MEITYKTIGHVRTPYKEKHGMPIQASGAGGVRGAVELKEDYVKGLKDLQGFSHIILLYHFHRSEGYALETAPFLDHTPRGVFATRAPRRPNPVGISVVKLIGIKGPVLEIENVDMLDGTPLIDIKPYVQKFDVHSTSHEGWLSGKSGKAGKARSDDRFST